jgi:hypothetical protein
MSIMTKIILTIIFVFSISIIYLYIEKSISNTITIIEKHNSDIESIINED